MKPRFYTGLVVIYTFHPIIPHHFVLPCHRVLVMLCLWSPYLLIRKTKIMSYPYLHLLNYTKRLYFSPIFIKLKLYFEYFSLSDLCSEKFWGPRLFQCCITSRWHLSSLPRLSPGTSIPLNCFPTTYSAPIPHDTPPASSFQIQFAVCGT